MPWHRDSKTKKPQHWDSKTKKPRHRFSMEFWPICPLTVTGLRKPEDDETNEDDALNVISAFTKEAGVDQTDFMKHVDKIHPIGGAKNGNQARIIKLTTNSFKEKVFLQHKRNKKTDNGKKKNNPKHKSQVRLNVQPSLSRNRIDLLRKANEAIEGNENFKFAYADMHGNLKFVLNKSLNRKYIKHFRSEDDICSLFFLILQYLLSFQF